MVELLEKIENYPNYSVSNLGRVRSDRKDLILKTELRGGYESVNLYNNEGCFKKSVHKLVHDAFCGGGSIGRELIVHHKDDYKLNNLLFNLELATCQENIVYSKDKSKTTSKFIGINYNKEGGKLVARYSDIKNKKRIYLGRFKTEELAYEALEKYKNNIKND